ncbi:MAG: glycosyl hydrolase 53 family protein [Saprospiraceae bacterium]|nr:glycosyl hydrolase 53 family protein [Saprospiraceae bacterium]
MMLTRCLMLAFAFGFFTYQTGAQNFYMGADLSYVNEMEDCGVVYRENGAGKDPYQIFKDNGCNLVRLRLWHTPAWYDTLNAGHRYSDLPDVIKSATRARNLDMHILLDFHLSDFWADPNRQLCPSAWLGVVNNLPLLEDSLYQYVFNTLVRMDAAGVLPEMVQIGNETNRGIMLSPAVDAAGWSLDWNRNSALFKKAIQAVRDVETLTGQSIKVALHIAGPADAYWLMQGFWNNGVTDFDIIGLSYYWAWHMPTSIEDAGNVVSQLRQQYPGKEVMIFETGYIWTHQSNDNAANIISAVHPAYAPASPENQKRWLIDMTQEVRNQGATGVMYWEPAWVSSPCRTPWGQGSHQEHATFFDFQNNLIENGGVRWMDHIYSNTPAAEPERNIDLNIHFEKNRKEVLIQLNGVQGQKALQMQLLGMDGKILSTQKFTAENNGAVHVWLPVPELKSGIYYVVIYDQQTMLGMRGFAY